MEELHKTLLSGKSLSFLLACSISCITNSLCILFLTFTVSSTWVGSGRATARERHASQGRGRKEKDLDRATFFRVNRLQCPSFIFLQNTASLHQVTLSSTETSQLLKWYK